MNHIAIIRVLAYMGLALGASMAAPLLVAILSGETQQIVAFGLTGLLTMVMAGVILLLTEPAARPARVNDALAVAIIWCFGAPIPAAIPFVFGTAELSFLAGLHEAVSCLTTTGHSIIDLDGNPWPNALLVWRAILHFIGMLFSLTIAASIFAALGFAGPGVHRSFLFTVPEGSFFDAIPRALRAILIICICLILFVFSFASLNGIPPGTSLSLAISVASTGLVDPNGYTTLASGAISSSVLFIGLFIATAGLAVVMNFRPRRLRYAEIDPELYLLLGLIGFVGLLAWSGGLGITASLGWAMSALSTSGIPINAPLSEITATLPLTVLVLPALIGGSALSTAGGIKLARIIILIRRAGQEFARLGFQHSIVALKFRERHQKERTVLGVWVYLIAYSISVAGVFIALSFLGVGFSQSISDATGAISNSGWLISPPANASAGYHFSLIAAMVLGRLEILALLPALNPSFWRR